MNDKTGFEPKASDAELIALLRKVQEEIEGHLELNESNLLLHDFARELLRQRLLLKSSFGRGSTLSGSVLALTTHRSRRCPYFHEYVYRKRRRGGSQS
jgi:hypothetical protein